MKKIIRLSESDLVKLVKKVINEQHIHSDAPFIYKKKGDFTKIPGMNIKYFSPKNEEIGFCNLLDFDNSYHYDWYVEKFDKEKDDGCITNCEENFFNGNNCLYLYDLRVHDAFKGNGYSKKLMNKCYEIARNNGYDYLTLITDCDNVVAQNLYKKLGYKLHQSDGEKDFLFLEL